MSDTVTVTIEGLDDLARRMADLPLQVEKRIGWSGLRAGAAVIRTAARNLAPVWTGPVAQGHPPPGTLKRSIVAKDAREKSTPGYLTELVTVRSGARYQKQGATGSLSQDAYYWWWVEFGNSKMSARPYMRPAFMASGDQAVDAIAERLEAGINEEAARR